MLSFDNAPVVIVCPLHEVGSEVLRMRKRLGKKSTNAKKAQEAFGEEYEKEMPVPQCVARWISPIQGISRR